ncbi:MAG: hypothetical protein NC302_06725 [Bacteroidales bacterium]|nr:hypothetical protein [Bacteroidales bacterium]MCM1415393.1 hypothetical protein [bacterium]MCM1423326.1 hypothetical protein [bacterium]
MIYRVGDGNNPAYDYTSQLKSVGNAEGQEKFSLEHQKEQAASPKKEDKGEDKKLHEKPGAKVSRKEGVRLEISGKDRTEDAAEKETAKKAEVSSGAGFLSIVQTLIAAVKDFFYRIWNDEPPETVFSEDVTPEEAERYTEEYYAMKGISPERTAQEADTAASDADTNPSGQPVETPQSFAAQQAARDEKIRGHLRSGDLNQVISLLTDNGKRAVAKNSTLLTYYDKNGKLTQLSASDRERILHGDRNMRTL